MVCLSNRKTIIGVEICKKKTTKCLKCFVKRFVALKITHLRNQIYLEIKVYNIKPEVEQEIYLVKWGQALDCLFKKK